MSLPGTSHIRSPTHDIVKYNEEITLWDLLLQDVHTILPQIMARALISFRQLFTLATKQDRWHLLVEVLNQSLSGYKF